MSFLREKDKERRRTKKLKSDQTTSFTITITTNDDGLDDKKPGPFGGRKTKGAQLCNKTVKSGSERRQINVKIHRQIGNNVRHNFRYTSFILKRNLTPQI